MMNLICAALFAGIALTMICRARFERTRRVAFVLMGACVVELLAAGLLSLTAYPVLTALLIALRLALMACGVAALRADAAAARRRAERRRAFVRQWRCTQYPPVIVPSAPSVRRVESAKCA